ncbi:hypothetical protein ScPMuIL_004052 [Solemya velum]
MSASLVRQALALFEEDTPTEDKHSSKKKKTPDSSSFLGTNKQGVQKKRKLLREKQNRELVMRKKKQTRSVVDEYLSSCPEDRTEENLYYLQKLSAHKTTPSGASETVLNHHRGKLAKDRTAPAEAQESLSIFTDRDFDKFEEEYDFS